MKYVWILFREEILGGNVRDFKTIQHFIGCFSSQKKALDEQDRILSIDFRFCEPDYVIEKVKVNQ